MRNLGIRSYEEYASIERAGFKTPYVVEAERKAQKVLFYGSEHVNDPSHPQFNDIESRWLRFISEHSNPIALVEGHFDECSKAQTINRKQTIIQGGEAQFTVYLARRDNIPVVSPEPDRVWEANELAKEFGKDQTLFYYFIRQVGWWNGFTEKPDVHAEAQTMLTQMKRTLKWDETDFSLGAMETTHSKLFKKPLNWNDRRWVYDITTPTSQNHATNIMARRSGELRDDYILQEIQTYWKQGKSLFTVFGSGHAIRLEPAILKLTV